MEFAASLFLLLQVAFCADGAKPYIVWSQKSHIWSHFRAMEASVQNSAPTDKFVKSPATTSAIRCMLAYDNRNKRLVWSDEKNQEVFFQPLSDVTQLSNGAAPQQILKLPFTIGLNGLAVDYDTGNIYWTDKTNRFVAVTSSYLRRTDIYKRLIDDDVIEPAGIVVSSQERVMFWCDTERSTVSRANLDGRERRTIASQQGKPVSMVIKGSKLYWLDAIDGRVTEASMTGVGRRVYISSAGYSLYRGLDVFGDVLFTLDKRKLKLMARTAIKGAIYEREIDALPYDLIVMQSSQPKTYHECDSLGCEHLCLNTQPARCDCRQGWFLQLDLKSCKYASPVSVFSSGAIVWLSELTVSETKFHSVTMTQRPLWKGLGKVEALASLKAKETVYMGDAHTKTIWMGNVKTGHNLEMTVNAHAVKGISVDWTTQKVYWVDTKLRHLMVSNWDGRFHAVLKRNFDGQSIAIDPISRSLFYTTASSIMADSIMTSSTRVLPVGNVVSPSGLLVDSRKQELCWSAQGEIRCANLDGSGSFVVAPMNSYDVTAFQEHIVATSGSRDIKVLSRSKNPREAARTLVVKQLGHENDFYDKTYDIVGYGAYLEPAEQNPCTVQNGGCTHHCFPLREGVKCACAIGFKLASDGKKCKFEATNQFFTAFVDPFHKQIYQINNQNPDEVVGIPIPAMDHPVSFAYDSAAQEMYFIEGRLRQIRKAGLTGTPPIAIMQLPENARPEHLVLHEASSTLIYSDVGRKAIFSSNLSGDRETQLVADTVPLSITIDETEGAIYWTEDDSNYIRKCTIHTKQCDHVTPASASALSFSPAGALFYSVKNQIHLFNLTTKRSSRLYAAASNMQINALSSDYNYVYYSGFHNKALYRFKLDGSVDDAEIVDAGIFARITDIKSSGKMLPRKVIGVLVMPIAAGAGAGFLLLLLLLAGIFCFRRRKNAPAIQEEPVFGTFDDPNMENFESGSLQIASVPPLLPPRANGVANGNVYVNSAFENGSLHGGDLNGAAGGATAAAAVYGAGGLMINGEKPKKLRKTPHKTKSPPPSTINSGFNIGGKRAGSAIQRLTRGLRRGVSSIRWPNADPAPDITLPGPTDTPGGAVLGPERNGGPGRRRLVDYTPKTHEMPRGFAPASHAVPRGVRTTWNKKSAQEWQLNS